MLRLATLCATAIAFVQAKSISNVEGYTFENFVGDFGRKYELDEVKLRKSLFEETLTKVAAHNQAGASWTMGVNELSDRTEAEIKALKGLKKHSKESYQENMFGANAPDNLYEAPQGFDISSLPEHVDWREQGVMSPVKNQKLCGSCWAFATTETVEAHLAIHTGKKLILAPQDVVSCAPNPGQCGGKGGCEGATSEIGFAYVRDNGMALEADYPYEAKDSPCKKEAKKAVKILGYTRLTANSYEATMHAVATQGPMAISVDATTFNNYHGGVFDGCNMTNPTIDHAVQLVGYGTDEATGLDYWLVRNSWGPDWGEEGYIRIRRRDGTKEKVCGLDLNTADGGACKGDPKTATVCGTCGVWFDVNFPIAPFVVDDYVNGTAVF